MRPGTGGRATRGQGRGAKARARRSVNISGILGLFLTIFKSIDCCVTSASAVVFSLYSMYTLVSILTHIPLCILHLTIFVRVSYVAQISELLACLGEGRPLIR